MHLSIGNPTFGHVLIPLGGTQSSTQKSPILWLLRGTKRPMGPATTQCLQLNAAFKAHLLGAHESFPEVMNTGRAG